MDGEREWCIPFPQHPPDHFLQQLGVIESVVEEQLPYPQKIVHLEHLAMEWENETWVNGNGDME